MEGFDTNKKLYVKPSLLGDLFSQSRLDELRLGLPSVWSSASLSYVPQGLLSSQFSQSSNKHTSPINNLEQNTHILKTNLRQKVVKATPSKPYFATKTSLSLAPNLFLPKIQRYEFYPKFANLIKFNTFQFNEVVYNALAKHGYKSVRSKICNPACLPFLQSMYASKQSNLAKQVRYAKRSIASKQPLQTNQRFSKYDKAKKLKGNPLISKKLQTKAASVKKASAPKAQRRLNENRHANNVETRTPNIPFLGNHLLSHLDQNGIAKVGTWVSPGDILVGKVRPLANKLKSNRASTQLAWEIISNKKNESINVEDKSFRLPKGISGRVIRTEILPHSSSEQIHIYLAVKRKVQVGDKLAGRHGNKGIVSLVLPRQDMPYIADGTPIDIILSPLGVPSRMNVGQIYECLLGLAAKSLACDFKIDNSMASLGYSALKSKIHVLQNKRPYANYAKKTTFFGSETKNFTLTNALTNALTNEGNESLVDHAKLLLAHTNLATHRCAYNSKNCMLAKQVWACNKKTSACKKIHSKVIQARINTDLCFFNWIKVSNTSCIYSTYTKHLTTLSTRLKNNNNNRKLGITNKQIKDQDSYYIGTRLIKGSTAILSRATLNLNLKTAVNLIPNSSKTSKTTLIKFKQNKQLISYSNLQARNLVFLKLYHSRITCNKKWLFSLTNPGKMKIFDGRTGQPFSSWVTVGYAYMLKLIHLVDNKIHSRSTGPYSLITRQPVTGKARQGGQRIGEMEAWALEGFGAAYTLQEFFSFKGDDVSSRHQWQITSLSKLVGNTTAFKTFLSELRALCISLEFTGFTEGA